MFVLYFVLLASFAISSTLSGAPSYVSGRWVTDLNDPEDYDPDDFPPTEEESMMFENLTEATVVVIIEGQTLQTTPESYLLLGEEPNEVNDSKVWKIVLVTVILLTSLVGSLGTAYYLCIWRGGRIHYMPQKTYA